METEYISLENAIKAINDGKRVTHNCLDGKSIGKWNSEEAVHDVVHGWNDIEDPLHEGTTYFKEYISPVEIFDKENILLGLGGIGYNWVNDPDRREIPVDGWEILGN